MEETGLEIGDVKFLVATNDVMNEDEAGPEGKRLHYVTVYVTCTIVGERKDAVVGDFSFSSYTNQSVNRW